MSMLGTVVNGVIVPDEGVHLHDGMRVRIEATDKFEYPHPLAPYDREKELALLRESIAEMKAGVPGIPLKEAMAQIAEEMIITDATATDPFIAITASPQ